MTAGVTLFLIAGESSGDLLGAGLMRALRILQPGVEFTGIGGPMMQGEGLRSLFAMEELSVMGLTEIIPHVPKLLRRIRQTVAAIAAIAPDALVTIDSPGFCFRVARKAKAARRELRTIHYVAPSVWAWRPQRAVHMAKFTDHVLALLPFEPPLMLGAGMSCDFVGHPVVAGIQPGAGEIAAFRTSLGLSAGQRLLTLLPGSRHGELDRLLPVFSEVAARLKNADPALSIAVCAAPGMETRLREHFAAKDFAPIVIDPALGGPGEAEMRKRTCFAASQVALAASGTVVLELAASGTPMVAAYRAGRLTTWLVKRMALIDSANLVNIVSDSKAVPEFLFENCTAERIFPAVTALLNDPVRVAGQKAAFALTMLKLGQGGEKPAMRAARSVMAELTR